MMGKLTGSLYEKVSINSCIDHVSPKDLKFLFTNGDYVPTGLVIMREDL